MNHSAGFAGAPGSGLPVAPPPPPPPPVPGQVPALRISTASEAGPRRPQPSSFGEAYEPPAAIQNAMMTKDKKPFTYTPGMGGKLDLSQIRSPRMARRVAKNAEDEGIDGPPKSEAGATSPLSPSTPNMYSQPQVAVPVFPQGQQPAVNLRNSTLPRTIVPVIERQEPAARPTVRIETKLQPVFIAAESQSPTPPTSPTQVTLSKAPTPWMQKQLKQQEELPEWAKRTNRQDSNSGNEYQPQTPSSPLPRQIIVVNTPTKQQQQQPQFVPQQQMRPVRQEESISVPRIEDRPSVFSAMNEPGQHHQLMNSTPHHMSRWGNPMGVSGQPTPVQTQGVYVIPIQVDGQQYQNNVSSPVSANNYNPMQYQNNGNRNVQRNYTPACDPQSEPGPVQSKSFRVLQKITDTDAEEVDGEQLRKLQLTEDDKFLMNKFKEQVDGDGTYLHKEEDPRYRGSAIPSKAFRYLQNMTDSGDGSIANTTVPRSVNSAPKKPVRNFNTFEEVPNHVHVPASQQQVPEPKKYTGGAIPSRSFRILQAMTAPESIATQVTQVNRQDSSTGYVSIRGNQQGVYYSQHTQSPYQTRPLPFPSPGYCDPELGPDVTEY